MTTASPPQAAAGTKRVLIVEDELMIRMLLADMLSELGLSIAAEAARLDEALEAARNAELDVAILDVNLGGEPICPVADALGARGIPFVFATGYGERALPAKHQDRPTLKKPFQLENLRRALESAFAQV
jgi:CheY-like chemotaxis protein